MQRLIELTAAGEVDCFISTDSGVPDNFEKEFICRENICICVPVDNELNEKMKINHDYSLLSGVDFIFLGENMPLQKKTNLFFESYNIKPKSCVTVDQVSTAVGFCLKGIGVCVASAEAVADYVHDGKIVTYPLPEIFSDRDIYITTCRDYEKTEICARLIELVKEMEKDYE